MTHCPNCDGPVNESLRHCPSCSKDWGCPNVRRANKRTETEALRDRYQGARDDAAARGIMCAFDELDGALRHSSHVVVAMPIFFARSFLTDCRTLYTGYESLVGAPARIPAPFENDSERRAVGGRIFGSYAHEIRYGVLSLNGNSLPNYGAAFVRLRNVVIQDRVTFLHENSYLFANEVTKGSSWPAGYLSSWSNRHELASAKLRPTVERGSTLFEWARQLVYDGATRADDRVIEAHIFGPFNADSVESLTFAECERSRAERNDIECINEILASHNQTRGLA